MSQSVPDAQFVTLSQKGVHLWCQRSTNKLIQNKCCLASGDSSSPVTDCFISNDGNYLAITLKQSVQIYKQQSPDAGFSKVQYELPVSEAKSVEFSPKSTFLVIGTSISAPEDKNIKLYEAATGKLVYETLDKKRDLFQWTCDESLAYRMVGSELYFYDKKGDFSKPSKKVAQKIASYSVAHNPSSGRTYVAIFVKGTKGSPSNVKVLSYPHFDNVIAQQSLFKADSVEIKWNAKGDAMLLLAIKDVDTTGQSYYGESFLHFLDLKGNSFMPTKGSKKEGTVHSCEWLPNNEGFIAVYGRTPAAVTLFNAKGDTVFQFGEVPVNSIYLNPFANLVAFAGFGNLAGDVHVWNMKTRTKISHFQAADTTHFSWAANGISMLTSTQYARLKVANGFKVWDYLGNLLHTEDCRNEQSNPLHRLLPVASAAFQAPEIGANVKGKILSEKPVQKYIPPFLRNAQQQQAAAKKQAALKNKQASGNAAGDGPTGKEKKLEALKKKLQQIEKLKQSQAEGKQLEKNQLEKIAKEEEIIAEMSTLSLED